MQHPELEICLNIKEEQDFIAIFSEVLPPKSHPVLRAPQFLKTPLIVLKHVLDQKQSLKFNLQRECAPTQLKSQRFLTSSEQVEL